MLRSMTFIALAGLMIAAGPAAANGFRAASGPKSLVLNSDSSSGKQAVWSFDADGLNAIRTTITVRKLAYDPYHTPSFAITLLGGGRKVAVNIQSPAFRPPLTLRLERWVGKSFLLQIPFPQKLALNQKLDLKIDWDKNGHVLVEAGGVTQSVQMGARIEAIEFAASVGEIAFDPLELGYVHRVDYDNSWIPYQLR